MPEITPNTPFEDLLNASDFGKPGAIAFDQYNKIGTEPAVVGADYYNSFKDKINSIQPKATSPSSVIPVNPNDIDTSGRYPWQMVGADNEDLYAQGQGFWSKAINGTTKGLITAGTTFLQGTAGLLYGLGQWAINKKFSSLYDNDLSNALNSITSDWAENVMPNYASKKERDAEWWEADNIFTANFLFDKIIKNLGFSVGAIGSGVAMSGALRAFTGLVKGLTSETALYKNLDVLTKLEKNLDASLSTIPKAERLAVATSEIRKASNLLTKVGGPLSNVDRAVVSTLGAATESGIESLQNTNQYREAKIKEFESMHGYKPTAADMQRINTEAESVGNASFGLNMALLTATNYVQLPKILGSSYATDKVTLNGITRAGVGKAVEASAAKKGLGRFISKATNIAGLAFSPTEAFEEASQTAIQFGTQAYFDKKGKSQNTDVFDEAYDAYYKMFNTKEGMESLIIGGLSGGIQQSGILTFGKTGEIKERGWTGEGGDRAKHTNAAIDSLNKNNFGKAIVGKIDATRRSINIQADKSVATEEGDKLLSDEHRFDDVHNYVESHVKWGKYEFIKEDLEHARNEVNMPGGFEALQEKGTVSPEDTKEDYLNRLTEIERHAENVNSLYKSFNVRYAGISVKGPDGKDVRKYTDEVIEKMVYAASKIAFYDQKIPALSTNLLSVQTKEGEFVDVQGVIDSLSTGEKDTSVYEKERAKIESMETTQKDELLEALDDVAEYSYRKKKFYDEYEDMKANPLNHREVVRPSQETPSENTPDDATLKAATPAAPTHKITTKDGEEDLEEGVEYVVMNVDEDKSGHKFFEFPVFTLVGKNEDGTYAVISKNGFRKNVPADFLTKFKVGKFSDLMKNKKAKFFYDHANDVATFNFGKKAAAKILGKKESELKDGNITGRIWFDSKTNTIRFYYNNKNGKKQFIVVKGEDFSMKTARAKGFDKPKLNFGRTLTKEEEDEGEDIASTQEEYWWDERLKIIEKFINEASVRMDDFKSEIKSKKKELTTTVEEIAAIQEKIDKASPTRRGNFKRTTKAAMQAVKKLTNTKEILEKEIEELENDYVQANNHMEFYFSLYEDSANIPGGREDFLEAIKETRDNLADAAIATEIAIEESTDLLGKVEKALQYAIDLAKSLIAKWEARYPGFPTNYREIGRKIENIPNKEAGLFRRNKEALFPTVLEEFKAVEAEITNLEDLDIIPGERSVNELKEHLQALAKQLDEIVKREKFIGEVYAKFEKAFNELDEAQRQREVLLKNKDLLDKVYGNPLDSGDVGTGNPTINGQVDETNDAFNAAKPLVNAPSTTDPSGEHGYAPKQDYHKRHEVFLNAYTLLPDDKKKNIRVVLVNSLTEAELGFNGITDRVLGPANDALKAKKNDPVQGVVVAVYVESEGEIYHILDQKGGRIGVLGEQGKEAQFMDVAVYSTMSAAKTLDSKGKGRYIENQKGDTPQVISFINWYKNLREKWLGSKTPSSNIYEINVSSGIPRRIPGGTIVSPIGPVIHQEDLSTAGLVQVSVNGVLTVNGVDKKYPVGSPVLIKGNSSLILNNRNISEKEAENLYQAILHLAEKAVASDWNPAVTQWLRDIMFFSDPSSGTVKKTPGRNQIWVADGKLHIGKKEYVKDFTPADIMGSKEELLVVLQGAYMNVNNKTLRENKPFTEIVGWSKDGTPKTRIWKSYQYFLLSPTFELDSSADTEEENGKNRRDEIPLSVNIIVPKEGDEQGVFKQRYSTVILPENEAYVAPVGQAAPTQPSAPVPQKPGQTVQTSTDSVPGYKLDGQTEEFFEYKGNKIGFIGTAQGGEVKVSKVTSGWESYIESSKNLIGKIPGIEEDTPEEDRAKAQAALNVTVLLTKQVVKSTTPIATANVAPSSGDSNSAIRNLLNSTAPTTQEMVNAMASEAPGDVENDDAENNRLINSLDVPRLTEDEWDEFVKWMNTNLPNVPKERINHIIEVAKHSPGAWGALDNGIIKVYEAAEKGTEYHEAFEAVWKYYVKDGEKNSLHKEFIGRKGSFIERGSGNKIEYKDATIAQAKEELADEFFDYIKSKKIPVKTPGQKHGILKFFIDLLNTIRGWVKDLFSNKANTLFKKINTGYYKNASPVRSLEGVDYARRNYTTEQTKRELMETLSANVIFNLLQDKDTNAFYNFGEVPVEKLYEDVRKYTIGELAKTAVRMKRIVDDPSKLPQQKEKAAEIIKNAYEIRQLIENKWKDVVADNKEFLRKVLKIKVTDEGVEVEENQKSRNDYARDSFFIDTKQSAPKAVKLLFMTLVETDRAAKVEGTNMPELARNSFGGPKLVKSSKAFIEVMKAMVNTNTVQGMMEKLYDLSKTNPDYARLYKRLKGNTSNKGQLEWDKLSFDDLRLIFDFYSAFAKQAPTPFLVSYKENGDVVWRRADLNSQVNNIIEGWASNIRKVVKTGGSPYITKGNVGKLTSYTLDLKDKKIVFTGDAKDNLKKELLPIINSIGIDIDISILNKLSGDEAFDLKRAIEDFLLYNTLKGVTRITKDGLGVGGPLSTMAEIILNNSEIEDKMTYFNVENEQQQLYIDDNFFSKLTNTLNDINSLDELKSTYPIYNDVFSRNSIILKRGGDFFDDKGNRIKDNKISLGYLNGILTQKGPKTVGKFTKSERMLSFINGIISPKNGGYYPVITPADSSTEYLIKFGRFFEYKDMWSDAFNRKLTKTFSGYLEDEMNLMVNIKHRVANKNVQSQGDKLRFFEGILRDSIKNKIQNLVKTNPSGQIIKDFVEEQKAFIMEDVNKFLQNKANRIYDTLSNEGKIKLASDEGVYNIFGIDADFIREMKFKVERDSDEDSSPITELKGEQLQKLLLFVEANHAASVIEIHKLVLGDPYQFTIKTTKSGSLLLDEAKRVKQFLSPRRSIASGAHINRRLNETENKVGNVELLPTQYGYTNFDDELSTITVENFIVLGSPSLTGNDEYDEIDRSDSQMWMLPTMHRETMLKSGLWSDKAEEFFQYDAAVVRQYLASKDKKWKKEYEANKELVAADNKLVKKGPPKEYKANITKPIITGPKSNRDYIDSDVDKMSAFPLYFTNMPEGTHIRELFLKMVKAGVDYAIPPSGRKMGVQKVYNFYENGVVNKEPIPTDQLFSVPMTNFGIQMLTEGDTEYKVTRGTQATKEITMDLMSNGVPIDYKKDDWVNLTEGEREAASPLYTKIKNNERLLDALTDHGYDQLLSDLSLVDNNGTFIVGDYKALEERLKAEVYRRDANDNTIDSVSYNPIKGTFNINFEASSSYQAIKNILLSIVDKNITSQKMNGGAKIQLSSALFDTDDSIKPYIKKGKNWEIVDNYESLSAAQKKGVRLFSTKLKYYSKHENGSVNRMQVLLPHWFAKKIRSHKLLRNESDEQILKMLNFTEEGRKILQGVGFRIPTQGHNFMDAFEIVGFLPQTAGDTIVLPAEITKKSGTDFDVDKLNVYLRNIYVDSRQEIKLLPFFGIGEEAIKKLRKFISNEYALTAVRPSQEDIFDVYMKPSEEVGLEAQGEEFFKEAEEEEKRLIPRLYKESLENAYIDSFEELLLYPGSYDRLTVPTGNNEMDDYRDKLYKALGKKEIEETDNISALLSLSWINTQRHNVIQGKELIGMGALGITHQSLVQKTVITLDRDKIATTYPDDKEFLGNGHIALSHNTVNVGGKELATLSSIYDRKDQYISQKMSAYTNGFVDAVKDSFLAELGVNRETGGTFVFLERVGVPTDTVLWFMNQPIIREFLKITYSSGKTFLFNTGHVEDALSMFPGKTADAINEKELFSNIEAYYSGKKFSADKNAEQRFILMEFLKYSKMAGHLREYQQATNWDTANFSDFTHSMIKNIVNENAKKHNIFGDPVKVLASSFLGNLRNKILKSNQSLSAILKFQHPDVQAVLSDVLYPLINPREHYLSDKEVIKIGNSVVSSFIDYIVQMGHKEAGFTLNSLIEKYLVSNDAVANEVMRIKGDKAHPLNNNYAFVRLAANIAEQPGEVNNVVNKLTDKDSFAQDQFISSLREIKETYPQLYRKLVITSVLQSGVKKSPISYTDLLPLEDYADIVNPIVESLVGRGNFNGFAKQKLFHRNNWGNRDKNITPQSQWLGKKRDGGFYTPLSVNKRWYAYATTELEKVIGQNNTLNMPIAMPMFRQESAFDVITVRRDHVAGPGIKGGFTQQQINEMKARKEFSSYKITIGYQKVRDGAGNPLIISNIGKDDVIYYKYIYKPINLYGDGIYAQEYYDDGRKSIIDNGTFKVDYELDDNVIIKAFQNDMKGGVPEGVTKAMTYEEFKESLDKKDCNK